MLIVPPENEGKIRMISFWMLRLNQSSVFHGISFWLVTGGYHSMVLIAKDGYLRPEM
jgi:hypothetical protein